MLTCNRLEAGGSKLKAWLTVADFFVEPQASCLKPISALVDGLMLVFHHPVKVRLAPRDSRVLTLAFQ
jgi:hypothetical protein